MKSQVGTKFSLCDRVSLSVLSNSWDPSQRESETDSTDASDGEPQRINPTENEKQPSPAKNPNPKSCAVKNKAADKFL